MQEGKQLHSHMILMGIEQNDRFKIELVNLYAECHIVEDVRQVFDKISEPDVLCWIKMIRCYSKHRFLVKALKFYYEMHQVAAIQTSLFFYVFSRCVQGYFLSKRERKLYGYN